MSIMFEKKARELLDAYMKAELAGQDETAAAIESQLNAGGWFITVGQDGTTIRRKGQEGEGTDMWWLPKDSTISPYKGGSDSDTNPNAKTQAVLIAVGIGLAVIGIVVLIAYIVKRSKDVRLQQG